jgi:precorrin-3B synthase
MLVRLRLVGGRLPSTSLRALADVADRYGDGPIRLTGRANLQLRGLPGRDGRLDPAALTALEGTGLLPSRTHELARNLMVSPQTGHAGGLVDLRPVASDLDRRLCADPRLAELPGRFLFVLDDGRGDLLGRPGDLGLVALDPATAQLRVGDGWGQRVAVDAAAKELVRLASEFVDRRGTGATAAWHVTELPEPLTATTPPDPLLPEPAPPLPYGAVPGGRHVGVPDTGLDRTAADALAGAAPDLVVTPWRGVLVPEEAR